MTIRNRTSMKTSTLAAIAVVIIIAAGACLVLAHNGDEKDDGAETITVTMSWEKDIVERIVGDDFRVVSMMGPNVNPHEAYSTPSNVSDLYSSKLYFKIGTGVEWETAFFDAVQKDIPSSVKIADISKNIEYTALPNVEHHHHEHEESDHEHEESATDAHIWTSPDILRQIAAYVEKEVSALNPDGADDYKSNLEKFNKDVDSIDKKMTEVASVAGTGHKHVMVWHPAWQYLLQQYADRFGIDIHMVSVEANGEVTPSQAVSMIKDEGCKSIFVSTTDEGYEGRSTLEDAGIEVHVVSPTSDDMLESISEFLDFLEEDFKKA